MHYNMDIVREAVRALATVSTVIEFEALLEVCVCVRGCRHVCIPY